jgi:hypothetical protein
MNIPDLVIREIQARPVVAPLPCPIRPLQVMYSTLRSY